MFNDNKGVYALFIVSKYQIKYTRRFLSGIIKNLYDILSKNRGGLTWQGAVIE